MEEDVKEVETETTEDSSSEEQQPEEESQDTSTEEPVDEDGVPIKNRVAEANRKLAKAKELSPSQAQKELLKTDTSGVETEDDAIEVVRRITREEQQKALEPVLTKQFLLENPDALNFIDDINRIRDQYPELKGASKLDVAFKIAKAERQDEIIQRKVEQGLKSQEEQKQKANNASITGTGKVTPNTSLNDQIGQAETLADLEKLASLIKQ
jgi:hypothetical protein